ncbi:MAG TPA: bifunctional riboflavin kinase/FAD synthetase [Herpetosiphonaceae bacterium]|nr:bifunctional riboflavin kinase/FAD synthetase [Herpetosiphonaceae bacterium]
MTSKMQLWRSLDAVRIDLPVALTIGAFDGIHAGHRHLIRSTTAAAARLGGVSAVLTFDPHPDLILYPERERLSLTSLEDREMLIRALDVDHMIVLPFSSTLAGLSAEAFMAELCGHVNLRELWVGPDFRLGAGGRGTVPVLDQIGRERNFEVHQVERFELAGHAVSSTLIRRMLADGDVVSAARLLERPYSFTGEVVQGDQRGRTIGFPTANIAAPAGLVVPGDGVYACHVQLSDGEAWLPAVTNIGVRPTFGALKRTVEAHLLDWSGDLYGRAIRVAFVERLRPEQKFGGIEALVAQIRADAAAARAVLAATTPTVSTG